MKISGNFFRTLACHSVLLPSSIEWIHSVAPTFLGLLCARLSFLPHGHSPLHVLPEIYSRSALFSVFLKSLRVRIRGYGHGVRNQEAQREALSKRKLKIGERDRQTEREWTGVR